MALRTAFGIVLIVIGLPLLLSGGGAAVYIGPDDTVEVVREKVSTDRSVISTSPSVLGLTGPTIHVSADAGQAEVFLGVAHPVHVDSYLDGVGQYSITAVDLRGEISSNEVDGDTRVPDAAPAGLDWWQRSASGPGAQTISFEPTEDPLRIVVTQASPEASLDVALRVGVEIDGLFVTALLVVAGGLVLTAGGVLLVLSARRRRRRATKPDPPGRSDADPDQDAHKQQDPEPVQKEQEQEATVTPLHGPRKPPPPPSPEPPKPTARLAMLFGLVALLAGCADLPQQVEKADRTSTVPAITPDAAETFLAQYSETNNAAGEAQDAELLATVETGTLLATSQFDFEVQQATGNDTAGTLTLTPSSVYAPRFDSYPMWALVTAEPEDDGVDRWYLITREDAAAPWLAGLAVQPEEDAEVPAPVVEDDSAVVADERAATRGREVLDKLVTFATSGTAPEDVDTSYADGLTKLPAHGLQLDSAPADFGSVDRTCALENPGEIRWLAARSGAMAMAAVSCTQTMRADTGYSVVIEDDGLGIIPGGAEIVRSSITQSASFIVVVEADGTATVYGQRMRPLAMSYTEP